MCQLGPWTLADRFMPLAMSEHPNQIELGSSILPPAAPKVMPKNAIENTVEFRHKDCPDRQADQRYQAPAAHGRLTARLTPARSGVPFGA